MAAADCTGNAASCADSKSASGGSSSPAHRIQARSPLYDTKYYGDTLIEIGKRIKGPMGDYYKALGSSENVIRALASGFAQSPGDNGVRDFESWKEKGVWYRKPYLWRQVNGEFMERDGSGYNLPYPVVEHDIVPGQSPGQTGARGAR